MRDYYTINVNGTVLYTFKGEKKNTGDQERQEKFYTLSLPETGTLYFYLLLKYQQIFDKQIKRVEEKRKS
jgi:hypothetical protein